MEQRGNELEELLMEEGKEKIKRFHCENYDTRKKSIDI